MKKKLKGRYVIFCALSVLATLSLVGCTAREPDATQNTASLPNAVLTASATAAKASPVQYSDTTKQAGVNFRHNSGAFGLKFTIEGNGSGVAWFDYDGDGYPDLFFPNGRDWTDAEIVQYRNAPMTKLEKQHYQLLGLPVNRTVPPRPKRQRTLSALYHNNRDGTFADVTRGSGLDVEMYGQGAAFGDYDSDGRPDLYVTGYGRNYLFHNEGNGKFRDVSQSAGVRDSGWSTSAAWVDYDKDGKLDLFVCHYVDWSPANEVWSTIDGTPKRDKTYVGPNQYRGQPSRLFRNLGNGRFEDVTKKARIDAPWTKTLAGGLRQESKALGVSVNDYNADGWPDIFVANDQMPNFLYSNNADGTFSEVAFRAGVAVDARNQARSGMGVDAADIDHSGRQSFIIGNFSNQMLGLYRNEGEGAFTDIAPGGEIGRVSQKFLAFGCLFTDADNDGWPDIFVANGHLQQEVAQVNQGVTYAERPFLFHNLGAGKFKEIGLQSGAPMSQPIVARGVAQADFDLDGDDDLAMTTLNGPAILLRNDSGNAGNAHNNALRIELRGTKSNRSAIGAWIKAQVGSETLWRFVRSGSSFCSQSELPVTLGLGQATQIEALDVLWPSNQITQLKNVAAGQSLIVEEGRGIIAQRKLTR